MARIKLERDGLLVVAFCIVGFGGQLGSYATYVVLPPKFGTLTWYGDFGRFTES